MKITDLEKTMGNFRLEVEHLEIEPGKIHGLVGHNGSGKTILLKLIMGILEPDKGIIDRGGLTSRDITMMSQRPYLLHQSVYDNLVYPLKIRGINSDVSKGGLSKIDELLERVGLLEQKNQYAPSLSSGERQKLSFLRAVIFEPKFIIMDETLSNMDPESEEAIISIIKEIQAVRPATWLIVNHQLEQKKELCDVIHYMEKGKIVDEIVKG